MTALRFRDLCSLGAAIRHAEGVPGGSAPPPSRRFPILSVMIAALLFWLTPDHQFCPKCGEPMEQKFGCDAASMHVAEMLTCVPCGTVWQRGEA